MYYAVDSVVFHVCCSSLRNKQTTSLSRVVIEHHSRLFLGPILEIGPRNLTSVTRLLSLGGTCGIGIMH